MYHNKENRDINNQLENYFYTRLLLNIDELPQDELFSLDDEKILFNNLSPDIWELLVAEVVHVPTRLPYETNNNRNQILLLVSNMSVETEKNIIMTQTSV